MGYQITRDIFPKKNIIVIYGLKGPAGGKLEALKQWGAVWKVFEFCGGYVSP